MNYEQTLKHVSMERTLLYSLAEARCPGGHNPAKMTVETGMEKLSF